MAAVLVSTSAVKIAPFFGFITEFNIIPSSLYQTSLQHHRNLRSQHRNKNSLCQLKCFPDLILQIAVSTVL
jgi:hypothetical protein